MMWYCTLRCVVLHADVGQASQTDKLRITQLRTDDIQVCMGNHAEGRTAGMAETLSSQAGF